MTLESILAEYYSIHKPSCTPLEGYDSINHKIDCEKEVYVLKQTLYSKETFALLESENHILDRLNELNELEFPRVIDSNKGDTLLVIENQIYRLLSFVKGDFLGDITHTPDLLFSFGTFLAKMDVHISDEYQASIVGKETQWDLKFFKSNYDFLKFIPDAHDRAVVDYFFLQFDEHISPLSHQLRKAIIHNDGNDWNVLTRQGKVTGIIDFGDMCHSWLINEVAIAITYVMMEKENPLEIASYLIRGYHEVNPLEEIELNVLYYLVAARLCTSVCNSAHAKRLKPDSDYIVVSEKSAWSLSHRWLRINPIRATNSFRVAIGYQELPKLELKKQLKRRASSISNALSLSYEEPIQMHQSAFQYMFDHEGNSYLDAYNNIMLVGHSHPKVVRASQRNMAKLNTNTRYLYDELLTYSEQLLSKFPSSLNKLFLVNSGSAASDLAIRLALNHTQKQKIMVVEHGYHGNTKLGIDISSYKYNQRGGQGKKEFVIETALPKFFDSGFEDEYSAAEHFSQHAGIQIDENQQKIAAFIAEPIVGCGGQVPLVKGYLESIYPKIRAQGGLCISDEVQVGFGRLGDVFWGYEMYDVIPDIVIIGKPMANGHPIGGVITTEEIADSFDNGLEFFSSFGGNPVSCAIGLAVLDVIEEEKLQKHAQVVGRHLVKGLRKLQEKYIQIADVRGIGLFLGVELLNDVGAPNTKLAALVKNKLRENYILISTDGPSDNVLKIKPPLSFNRQNADKLVQHLDSILWDILKKNEYI